MRQIYLMSLPFKRYFSNYSLNDGGMMGKIKQTLKIADSRFTCKVAVEFLQHMRIK